MLVCESCFNDKELKAFISYLGFEADCGVCNKKSVNVIYLSELYDFFQELADNFTVDDNGQNLILYLQTHWNFFKSKKNAKTILDNLLPKLNTEIKTTNYKVKLTSEVEDCFKYWDSLKENVKWSQRFIPNIDYLVSDLGWDGFFNSQFNLNSNKTYYRARVHHESGKPAYDVTEMGCPEPSKVSGGRANPLGIPYLYLADNEDTVLHEVRTSYLDELSIGSFKINSANKNPVKIVDFTEKLSLFQPNRINEIIKAYFLKKSISRDLSKPMRRYDSEIEYIPTQLICEFIRTFTGANGIQFKSSVHPEGKNLVLFDEHLMECFEVKLKRIKSLSIESEKITWKNNMGQALD